MRSLEGSVAELRAEVAANTATTEEVREILAAVKSGIRVLGWLGTAALWLVRFGGAVATAGVAMWGALYAITHGGSHPPKH